MRSLLLPNGWCMQASNDDDFIVSKTIEECNPRRPVGTVAIYLTPESADAIGDYAARARGEPTREELRAERDAALQLRDAPVLDVPAIVRGVQQNFRTFGGGQARDEANLLAHCLKDEPAQFAAGVDVAAVVEFVLQIVDEGAPIAEEADHAAR